ncbi:MAG: hypothetical protein IKH96_08735 [Ruminococcus sp.]|uniref:hypothetical protein n=1 Tax=Ruminococcus sp. TaxID=41978 RepID=UPI0025FC7788|nr:hypothetical protein [Ruminococcus sp.]MBR6996087.1 hypothetical protein [Ruminococcus sp.]
MKDKLDYLFSNKDSDIERVAEKYTAAGNKEKEKIYDITRKKYNILREEEANTSDDGFIKEAEGVERYSRPKWIRFVSAAAAAVVLLTGVCGGVFLTRSKKVDRIDIESSNPAETVAAVEVTTITDDGELVKVDMDKVVDKLSADLEHFHKALAQEGVDTGDSLTFSDLTYPNAPSYRNYYRVTDEKLDTFDEFEEVMGSSFSSLIREGYTGGDMSGYENGAEFDDISFIKKNLKSFINYNGNLYSEASVMPNASYSSNFANTFNFSNYELVSSEFPADDKERIKGLIEDGLLDDGLETMTCKRIYQRKDGTRVRAELILVNEDNAWKIGSYNVGANIEDQVVTTTAVTTAPVTTTPVNTDSEEFGELQMHQEPVFANEDEANALLGEVDYGWENGTYQFQKVDTEKYTQQIWNAVSYDELNTLENKSYIYHVSVNSFRYFDTADVSYTINTDGTNRKWDRSTHVIADNRAQYFHIDSKTESSYLNDDLIKCYYGNKWTDVNNLDMTYNTYESSSPAYELNYVPDNYRVLDYTDGIGGWGKVYGSSLLESVDVDCLYSFPDALFDFDDWYVEGVEEILGRQCVAIRIEQSAYSNQMLIDMRTGIVMRYTAVYGTDGVNSMKVTNLELNNPVEHNEINLTGYSRREE